MQAKKQRHYYDTPQIARGNLAKIFPRLKVEQQEKGMYQLAFTTVFHDLTPHQQKHIHRLALSLIGDYHHLLPVLMHLDLRRVHQTFNGTQRVYLVKTGKTVLGKLTLFAHDTEQLHEVRLIYQYRFYAQPDPGAVRPITKKRRY